MFDSHQAVFEIPCIDKDTVIGQVAIEVMDVLALPFGNADCGGASSTCRATTYLLAWMSSPSLITSARSLTFSFDDMGVFFVFIDCQFSRFLT